MISYWVANSNFGLIKILTVIFGLLFLGFFGFFLIGHKAILYLFLFLILVFVYFIFKKILIYGFNRKVFEDKISNFIIYDNKRLFDDKNGTRILKINGSDFSSRVWLTKSKNIERSAYLSELIDLIPKKLLNQKNSVLHLGGCANSIPLFFAVNYYKLTHDVVEIDKKLLIASKKYFYPLFGKNKFKMIVHYNDDAKKYMDKNEKKYSIIIQDIFINGLVPNYFLSENWFKKLIKSLKKNGIVLINLGTPSAEDVFKLLLNLPQRLIKKKSIGIKNFQGFVCLYFYNQI